MLVQKQRQKEEGSTDRTARCEHQGAGTCRQSAQGPPRAAFPREKKTPSDGEEGPSQVHLRDEEAETQGGEETQAKVADPDPSEPRSQPPPP